MRVGEDIQPPSCSMAATIKKSNAMSELLLLILYRDLLGCGVGFLAGLL